MVTEVPQVLVVHRERQIQVLRVTKDLKVHLLYRLRNQVLKDLQVLQVQPRVKVLEVHKVQQVLRVHLLILD